PATPPPGDSAVVGASLADAPEAVSRMTIRIVPAPPATAAPELPILASSGTLGARNPRLLSRPRGMLIGRSLVMSTRPLAAGRLRLSAFLKGVRIGTCAAKTPARRSFTCRVTLPPRVSLTARISIIATLVVHGHKYQRTRPAAPVPQMRMRPLAGGARL